MKSLCLVAACALMACVFSASAADAPLTVASRLIGAGTLELTVSGPPGTDVRVESSPDLLVWAPVGKLSKPDLTVTATYPVVDKARYFRAQLAAPSAPVGIWFGKFSGQSDNGGFGTRVTADGRAVVVGYNTPQDEGLFQSGIAVSVDGSFDFISQEGGHITGGFKGATVNGSFADPSLPGGTFSGTREAVDGPLANAAGYYSGTYAGALTGVARAVVAASGKLFFYTNGDTGSGGGFGQINTQNQLSAQTVAGAVITGTLNPATLSLSGTYAVGGQVAGTFQLTRQPSP